MKNENYIIEIITPCVARKNKLKNNMKIHEIQF